MRIVGVKYVESGYTCESCGKDIKTLVTIDLDEGVTKIYGTDCAAAIVAAPDIKLNEKRVSRAIREWSSQKSTRRDGESKEEYVNRRVREMANALRAWKATQKLNYWPSAREIVAEIKGCTVEELNIPECGMVTTACQYAGITPQPGEVHAIVAQLLKKFAHHIDITYQSNVADWGGKTAYQIKKV